MESSHFLAVSSPCGTLQNCFSSIFDLGPLTPKIDSPKFCTESPISRLVWQMDRICLHLPGGFRRWPIQRNHAKCCGPTLVAMATKFALGAESNRLPAYWLFCLPERLLRKFMHEKYTTRLVYTASECFWMLNWT